MYATLLIEDNPHVVFFFREVIAKHPNNMLAFEYADDLRTGLELIEKNVYSLIVLDLILPDSDEENTIVQVATRAKDTAIIVLTAAKNEKLEDFALLHGVEDYISKDAYDVNTFFHACGIAVKRKLSLIHKDVMEVQHKLSNLLTALEEIGE